MPDSKETGDMRVRTDYHSDWIPYGETGQDTKRDTEREEEREKE